MITDYETLDAQAAALLDGEFDALANVANFVALLYANIPDTNWVGYYVLRGDELVLGPFQGKPACTRIPLGRGVCGTAAVSGQTQRIADVHAFDGHIACDPESKSELVVPIVANGKTLGVLDLDSPSIGRFSADDQAGVENLCRHLYGALSASATLSVA